MVHILENPELTLANITAEYNKIEESIKTLLNTAPYAIDTIFDFKDYRRQQLALEQQRDQLFNN